jgi:hypothetical protein
MDIRQFFNDNRRQCEAETQLINSMGNEEVKKDAKQLFIEGVNEWVVSLKDATEKAEKKRSEGNPHCLSIGKKSIETKIDDVSVEIDISYSLEHMSNEKEFSIHITDNFIYWSHCGSNYSFLIGEGENADSFVKCETVEELYEKIVEIKKYKYCNKTGNFLKDLTSDKMMEALDIILDNEKKECSVCLKTVGNTQKLKCGHFCCRQCRHEMLRRKNKKCPLCRDENLNEQVSDNEE